MANIKLYTKNYLSISLIDHLCREKPTIKKEVLVGLMEAMHKQKLHIFHQILLIRISQLAQHNRDPIFCLRKNYKFVTELL